MPTDAPHQKRIIRVGLDVGGTFTDFMALSEDGQEVWYHKVPSTPDDPSRAIVEGLAELIAMTGRQPGDVGYLGHGTTVATNMVIERRGSSTALVTTRGFRDVLEIARQTRPHLYDYRVQRAEPLAPRRRRLEVSERVSGDGQVLEAVSQQSLAALVRGLEATEFESLAVSLLHAYRNPVHEKLLADALGEHFPDAFISVSSEVSPEFREFERTSTTVLNAYVAPRMGTYVERLRNRVDEAGVTASPFTVQSNGGLMAIDEVRKFPVRTCLSGPAAGVVGAASLARALELDAVVTFDVGGTSTDVSLIVDAKPAVTMERDVAGYTTRSPMIDVHVIGAGGGSIASVDDAGGLKVGPESAGAHPGPAAYGLGGDRPTITDAHVVLGRLNPAGLLNGALPLDEHAARGVLQRDVAGPLELEVETAALGTTQVAVAHIARAIRAVTSERGQDPRDVTLCAYGGAGPLLATAVAREVECRFVVVPHSPGTLCARGILSSDMRRDYVSTLMLDSLERRWMEVASAFSELTKRAVAWFDAHDVATGDRQLHYSIDARYTGQSFEVAVEAPDGNLSATTFVERFHAAHEASYGYAIPSRGVTLVNCRLVAVAKVPKSPLTAVSIDTLPTPAPHNVRQVFHDETGWQPTPVYQRDELKPGHDLVGPAIIEEMSSTVYLGPHDQLRVDGWRNLVLDVSTGSPS